MKKQLTSKVVIGLAALLMTGSGGINPSFAAPPATPAQEPKKVFDAHDTGVRFHFNDTDMDFHFGTIVLGSAVNHGVEIGEAFYAASRIKDGDAASWQDA